jgi:hypothetical protein
MRVAFPRAALAAAVLAGSLGALGATSAHATDACDNDGGDPPNLIVGPNANPTLRVGVDDPTTGYPGVVVVCLGALGNRYVLQIGAGVYVYFDSSGNIHAVPMICDPDCHSPI